MIAAAQRLSQTETYYFAQKMAEIQALNDQGHQVINLGVGSPDLGPHPSVTQALMQALDHDRPTSTSHSGAYQDCRMHLQGGINSILKLISSEIITSCH
jgi:aspartate/methionine/tyrosine aminotransferase